MAKIGIVTVLYNSSPVLEEFFLTLNKQTYKDFVLYVIDNKSSDNSLKETDRLSRIVDFKTIILPQTENGGVAKGNNIGINAALLDKCEYVLLANNDIVLENDAIEKLLEGLFRNGATMAVPKIYYWGTDKIIWMAGGDFIWKAGITCHRGEKQKDTGEFNEDININYAPTCFMLISSDVFGRIGMMDEKYFVYFDDSDFVWRSVKEGTEKLFYISGSVIWHKVSVSTGGEESDFSIKYFSRNRIYFARKHFSLFHRLVVYIYVFSRMLFIEVRLRDKSKILLKLRSLIEGFRL